jgi:hypothetical protein
VLRFFRLPPAERRLFIESWFLLLAVHPALRLIPFPELDHWLRRLSAARRGISKAGDVESVVRAVMRAGRFVPASACLSRALAARTLLLRKGYPAILHIGVAKDERSVFKAHAWLTLDGRIIIGSQDETEFTPLVAGWRRPS